MPESVPLSEPESEHPDTVSTAAVASATPDISPIRILIRILMTSILFSPGTHPTGRLVGSCRFGKPNSQPRR
ncbi:hypothetical protein Pd630_LPD16005 (plasmid) [Rhodococcus opacus PD630]|nr:hypothetical protein Pd630_LPD16005 [Rhodococcus opacus PD630]